MTNLGYQLYFRRKLAPMPVWKAWANKKFPKWLLLAIFQNHK